MRLIPPTPSTCASHVGRHGPPASPEYPVGVGPGAVFGNQGFPGSPPSRGPGAGGARPAPGLSPRTPLARPRAFLGNRCGSHSCSLKIPRSSPPRIPCGSLKRQVRPYTTSGLQLTPVGGQRSAPGFPTYTLSLRPANGKAGEGEGARPRGARSAHGAPVAQSQDVLPGLSWGEGSS